MYVCMYVFIHKYLKVSYCVSACSFFNMLLSKAVFESIKVEVPNLRNRIAKIKLRPNIEIAIVRNNDPAIGKSTKSRT